MPKNKKPEIWPSKVSELKLLLNFINKIQAVEDFIDKTSKLHMLKKENLSEIFTARSILKEEIFTNQDQILKLKGFDQNTFDILIKIARNSNQIKTTDILIGSVIVTPQVAVAGQSVLVEVMDVLGFRYSNSDKVNIRINGVRGARQFLQFDFDTPWEKVITILATKDKKIEIKTEKVKIVSKDEYYLDQFNGAIRINEEGRNILLLKKPPLLYFGKAKNRPYVASFSFDRYVFFNGFSSKGDHVGRSSPPPVFTSDLTPDGPLPFPDGPLPFPDIPLPFPGGPLPFPGGPLPFPGGPKIGAWKIHEIYKSDSKNIKEDDVLKQKYLQNSTPFNLITPVPGGIMIEPLDSSSIIYEFNFGEGTTLTTNSPTVEHDFEPMLDPNKEDNYFDIKVKISEPGKKSVEVARSLYIHNSYALCKNRGFIIPKVSLNTYASKILHAWEGIAIIHNVEPYSLLLTQRIFCPILNDADEENNNMSWTTETLANPIVIPAKTSLTLPIIIPSSNIPSYAIGFSVVYCGTSSGKAIRVETYFEFEPKLRANLNAPLVGNISFSSFLKDFQKNTVEPLQDDVNSAISLDVSLPSSIVNYLNLFNKNLNNNNPSSIGSLLSLLLHKVDVTNENATISNKMSSMSIIQSLKNMGVLDESGLTLTNSSKTLNSINNNPKLGDLCDPNNIPDDIYNNPDTKWACQIKNAPPEIIDIPGRFLNARKGDIVLSPGGPSIIGQLLLQVTPPQKYSHSGIMTLNYERITHSTASQERLMDYNADLKLIPFIPIPAPAPINGFPEDVLRYGWPGIITQTAESSINGEEITDPENKEKKYHISGFSRESSGFTVGGHWEIVNPLVIKPDPLLEAKDKKIRKTLRSVASKAYDQTRKGHYRFYAYTDPSIAKDTRYFAQNTKTWADGTWPSVCSSFIWHMLKSEGVSLESSKPIVSNSDLENKDIATGAEVAGNTKDGLYFYSQEERTAAGEYLSNELRKQVEETLHNEAKALDGLIDFFTRMTEKIPNQIVNMFASDLYSTEEEWKKVIEANAVSPDNMLFWDSPEKGGLYGYCTPLLYRVGRKELVNIYEWHEVRIKGTVWGVVTFNGNPQPRTIVQICGLETFTDARGEYKIDHVPYGNCNINASTDLVNGLRLAADESIKLDSPVQRLDIKLEPPSDSFRRLTIDVQLSIYDHHTIGDDPRNSLRHYREIHVNAFEPYKEIEVGTSTDLGENRSAFRVLASWNFDKSITIQWILIESGENNWNTPWAVFNLKAGYIATGSASLGIQQSSDDHSNVYFRFTNERDPVG